MSICMSSRMRLAMSVSSTDMSDKGCRTSGRFDQRPVNQVRTGLPWPNRNVKIFRNNVLIIRILFKPAIIGTRVKEQDNADWGEPDIRMPFQSGVKTIVPPTIMSIPTGRKHPLCPAESEKGPIRSIRMAKRGCHTLVRRV